MSIWNRRHLFKIVLLNNFITINIWFLSEAFIQISTKKLNRSLWYFKYINRFFITFVSGQIRLIEPDTKYRRIKLKIKYRYFVKLDTTKLIK